MRGKFFHNQCLVAPVAARFLAWGATVHLEHPVREGRNPPFIDLYVEWESWVIACEAELSPDRGPEDVAKAVAVKASLLLIVTPTGRIARSVRNKLASLPYPPSLVIWVLPLGTALHRLANKSDLKSSLNVTLTFNLK